MTTRTRTPRILILIEATATVLLIAGAASATTRTVPNPFATIQAALTASSAGDTVLVAAGTYTGAGNRDLTFPVSGITLLSESGPEQTVIDCQGAGRALIFTAGGPENVVQGFALRNGATGSAGGAVECVNASPVIRNCILTANGAALGGAIAGSESTPLIDNCEILDNTASSDGGGVLFVGGAPHLQSCRISGNSSGGTGGGVFSGSPAVLTSLVITGNTAGDGGGIGLVQFTPVLSNCTISGNTASSRGGGLYVGPAATVQGAIVWDNCAPQGPDVYVVNGPLTFSCSDVDLSQVAGPLGLSSNLFSEDPLFCRPQTCNLAPTSDSNYTLKQSSPMLITIECGTIGGLTTQCDDTPVMNTTWGDLKSRRR